MPFDLTSLIPNSSGDNLLQEIIDEYKKIKQQIEEGGVEGAALNILRENAKELQELINKFVAKDKKITEKEYNEAYEKIRESRMNRLKKEMGRTKRFFIIAGGIGVLALGFYIYKRLKSKKG
jgi:hypothetical protein